MAVRLRLRRIGKKKQPQYRLVAAEASGPRDGRFIESLGHYNPRLDPPAVSVNEERALWWLQRGAQPTDTAKSLLVKTGVWEKFTGEPAPVRAAPVVAAPAVAPPASEAAPIAEAVAADEAEQEEVAAADSVEQEEVAASDSAEQEEAAGAPDSSEQDTAAASEEGPAAEEQNVSPGETAGGTEEAAKADN